ncbi:hypothetical protein, partial [Mycoplasmopsis bovis]|uniref:hypothetical protein n=1 Tax=Mycoplasmopsis bovis TaxID=28903 RepID=UPI003D26B343
ITQLPTDIKYPMKFKFSSAWELRKFMLKENNLSLKIYKKNYWLISKLSKQLFDEFNNFTGNWVILVHISLVKSEPAFLIGLISLTALLNLLSFE